MKYLFKICLLVVCACVRLLAQDYQNVATLNAQKGQIQNVRFSPNGKMLAAGEQTGYVIVWDVATRTQLKTMKGHSRSVNEVTFNKDGSKLASTSEDGTTCVWDTKTWKLIGVYANKPFIHPDGTMAVSASFVVFSPDSRYIYFSGDNGYIMRADLNTADGTSTPKQAEVVTTTNLPDGRWYSTVTGGTLSADEKNLIVSVGNMIFFFDLKTFQINRYLRYDENYFNDVVNAPMPNSVATWSFDGKVLIWDNNTGNVKISFQVAEPKNYSAASFSKDGKYLVTSASGTVAKVWDVSNGRQVATLTGHDRIVRISRYSPTEDLIATASYDGTVKLWATKVEEPLIAINQPKNNEDPKTDEPKSDIPITSIPKEEPKIDKTKETNEGIDKLLKKEENLEVGKTIALENVLFEQSSYRFKKEAYEDMDKVVQFLKENPKVEIELSGHTDNVGDARKNQNLSDQRVIAVKTYLIRKGIDEKRIQTVAYGGSKPIASNTTEAGRQKNRRVEMKILKI